MRYIIAAPPYSRKSAGIVVLHELQKWLIKFGKDAMILNFKVPYEIEEDDIVVYPEIVSGNPLKARRVIRYILNEPGKLGGDKEYDKKEILVAYDGALAKYSNGVVLTIPILEEFFSNRGYDRTIECLWVGKGENTNHPITRNCIEITYQWPSKRRELAELLNRAKTLYSYDDRTSLLTEAFFCGCQVKLLKNNEIVDYPGGPPLNLDAFKKQLEQFINLTWYPEINPAEAAIEIDKQLSIDRSKGRNSALPSHTPKTTSIIILTRNQLKYTKACVESIQRHTKEPHEIIFVDNGSTDGTVKWLQKTVKENGHYRLILNRTNLGFARGCNQGIQAATGEYILLLNNDAVVTVNWLKRMITCAEAIPQSGMVGPMSNYVSGPQLLQPVNYDTGSLSRLEDFAEEHAGKHRGQAIPFWRVVGFCMLIKRAVIEKIGGLDERYGLGNFEDDDFSLRATLAGFQSWITLDSFVHHFGNRTFADAGIDYKKSLDRNWGIFKRKWGIPEETAYGTAYNLKEVLNQGFNSIRHYFPLDAQDSDLARGEDLYAMGDAEGARTAFERIVRHDPKNAGALNNLGVIAFQQGATDDAQDYFNKVLEIDPNHFESAENLGNCMVVVKAYEKAAQWFERALRLKADDATVLNSLANCFMQIEDFAKAREAYTKSYQLNSNQPKVEEVLSNLETLRTFKAERRASL